MALQDDIETMISDGWVYERWVSTPTGVLYVFRKGDVFVRATADRLFVLAERVRNKAT